MIAVTLTPEEFALCADYARKRADMHEANGIGHHRADHTRSNFAVHVAGIVPEYAWAKHLGPEYVARWEAESAFVSTYTRIKRVEADVGDRYEIRSTEKPHGCLLLHEKKDKPDSIYVLALTDTFRSDRTVRFVGWVYGREGLYPENRSRLPNCTASHAVPQDVLYPMETLP